MKVPAGGRAALGEHVVMASDFAELSGGFGAPDLLRSLSTAQITRRMAILLGAARSSPRAATALAVLAVAQRSAPGQIRGLLAHPFIGTWADAHFRPHRGRPDAMYLSELVAVAAFQAGIPFEGKGSLVAGEVRLPTLGIARVGAAGANGVVTLRSHGSGLAVSHAGGRVVVPRPDRGEKSKPAGWLPMQRIMVEAEGLTFGLIIDDVDRYRDCFHLAACERTSAAELARFEALLGRAWTLLVQAVPEHARAIPAVLKTVVPLVAPPRGDASATCRSAFGAIGLHLPGDPVTLAMLLVHEYMHAKLGALLDLIDLVNPGGRARFTVGWRSDPRPAAAVLQGAYAHLGVVHFWHALRGNDPMGAADARFRHWRRAVADAVALLAASGDLTPAGDRFVAGMSTAVTDL